MRYEYKEIVNSAIHTYLHGETELEFKVKDYIHEVYEKAELYDQNKEKIEAWDELWDYVNSEIHQLKESGYVDDQATLANYKRIRDEMRKIKRAKAEEGAFE